MIDEEFEDLINTSNPVRIEQADYPKFGFVIVFDNGKKVRLTTSSDFGLAYIEFEEL